MKPPDSRQSVQELCIVHSEDDVIEIRCCCSFTIVRQSTQSLSIKITLELSDISLHFSNALAYHTADFLECPFVMWRRRAYLPTEFVVERNNLSIFDFNQSQTANSPSELRWPTKFGRLPFSMIICCLCLSNTVLLKGCISSIVFAFFRFFFSSFFPFQETK